MPGRPAPSSLLHGGAAVAAGDALAADVAFGDHPVHSVVLAVVVAVVAALRRLGCRALTVLTAASAALAAQPALHLLAEAARSHSPGHDGSSPLHHLLTEAPTAGVQVVVPAVAVVAAAVCGHLIQLLIRVVRRPQASPGTPFAPTHVLVSVRARRLGSMRRWCGWVLQAARRGPPSVAGYGIPRTA
jgi:hypothetical protein